MAAGAEISAGATPASIGELRLGKAAEREAINMPIQGTASDIVKIAMIRVAKFLQHEAPEVRMLLQVHDELLFEGPEADLVRIAPELCEIMVGALEMKARLHVDLKIGLNWEDMKPMALRVPRDALRVEADETNAQRATRNAITPANA